MKDKNRLENTFNATRKSFFDEEIEDNRKKKMEKTYASTQKNYQKNHQQLPFDTEIGDNQS